MAQPNTTLSYAGVQEIKTDTTLTVAEQGVIRVSADAVLTLPTVPAYFKIIPHTDDPAGLVDTITVIVRPAANQRLYALGESAPAVAKGVVYKGVSSSATATINVHTSAQAGGVLEGDWKREA